MEIVNKVLLSCLLFVCGAGMGSFVSMLVWRTRKQLSFFGRSMCEKCRETLSVGDLIPIVSWLSLRGRCRKCHKKIDKSIIIIEIVMATLFVISFWLWPRDLVDLWGVLQFALWLAVLTGLVALFGVDIKTKKLPNKIMFPTMLIAAIFAIITGVIIEQNSYSKVIFDLLLAMIPVAGVYGLIHMTTKGRMIGLGDVKLGIIVGFLLPWWGGVAVLGIANLLSFIILLPMLVMRHVKLDDRVAFGPFLVVATIVVFLCLPLIKFPG